MNHLSLQDIIALSYHLELGDILEPDDYAQITKHLDTCDICKNRYDYIDGKAIDKSEKCKEELNNIYLTILFEIEEIGFKDESSAFELLTNLVQQKWRNINHCLSELKLMGFSTEESLDSVRNILSGLLMKRHSGL